MLDNIIENLPKVHSRDIRLATYSHSDSSVIVHGILKDERYKKIFDVTGEVVDPGIVHHIDVKLLIRPEPLRIEEARGTMLKVPMNECRQTLELVENLTELEIKSGFSKQIRDRIGGPNGCTHLCNLVIAMGQEIVQGWLTHKRQKQSPVPADWESFRDRRFLVNSCRMWAENDGRPGPKLALLKKSMNSKK